MSGRGLKHGRGDATVTALGEGNLGERPRPSAIESPSPGRSDDFALRESPGGPTDRDRRGVPTVPGDPERQLDIFLPARASKAERLAALETLGPCVRHVQTGTFPSVEALQ